MKPFIVALFVLISMSESGHAQAPPTPVSLTHVDNITLLSNTIIDNRSAALRQNNAHMFCATGSGTWSAQIQYQDGSSTGAWSNFTDITSVVNNATANCSGGANGYHDYIRFLFTGANASTVKVSYSGVKNFYLFTVPVGSTSTVNYLTQVTNLPQFDQRIYSIFSISASGNLSSVGNKTIALTPCPPGLNGSDVGHSVYISGGTGTAEAVLITGGTCTGGAGSGTITVTTANPHSGAWTVSSASNGIQEAIVAANSGPGGIVQLNLSSTVHAAITIPNNANFGSFIIQGSGSSAYPNGIAIVRASDYPAGDIFSYDATTGGSGAVGVTIRDITIFNGGQFGTRVNNTSGAAVHVRAAAALPFILRNVEIDSGYRGIDIDGSITVVVDNCRYYYAAPDYTFAAQAGLIMRNTGVGFVPEAIIVNSSFVAGQAITALANGILIQAADGVTISNCTFGGSVDGIGFQITTGTQIDTVTIIGSQLDTFAAHGIHFSGDGGTPTLVGYLTIANNHITGLPQFGGGIGNGIYIQDQSFVRDLQILGNRIQRNGLSGIRVGITNSVVGPIEITSNAIYDNNTSSASTGSGIEIGATSSANYHISGNHIYNALFSPGHQLFGIIAPNGGFIDSSITGNDFHVVAGATAQNPIAINSANVRTLIHDNGGVDDVIPTIAGATTLAFPLNPQFVVSGTTGATAVNMTLVPPGSSGTFRTPDGPIVFTTGGGIGNGITTSTNVPVIWTWDGTHVWLK